VLLGSVCGCEEVQGIYAQTDAEEGEDLATEIMTGFSEGGDVGLVCLQG
jgi:hypothetical protein